MKLEKKNGDMIEVDGNLVGCEYLNLTHPYYYVSIKSGNEIVRISVSKATFNKVVKGVAGESRSSKG